MIVYYIFIIVLSCFRLYTLFCSANLSKQAKMGLKPLEYLECYLDSPAFRENLLSYEKELENNSLLVKNLTKECRRLIQATEGKPFYLFVDVVGSKLVAHGLSTEAFQLQNVGFPSCG